MSYDLFTFRLPPGADPSDYATEVVESWEDAPEFDPSAPTVAELVAAFRAVFPEIDVVEDSAVDDDDEDDGDDSAMLLLEDQLVSIELWPSHSEICISYAVAKDEAWIANLLAGIARAAAKGGHDTLFDAQLDRPILPQVPSDAAAIGEVYAEGLGFVGQIRAEHEAETQAERGGFFKRLFGRG